MPYFSVGAPINFDFCNAPVRIRSRRAQLNRCRGQENGATLWVGHAYGRGLIGRNRKYKFVRGKAFDRGGVVGDRDNIIGVTFGKI